MSEFLCVALSFVSGWILGFVTGRPFPRSK